MLSEIMIKSKQLILMIGSQIRARWVIVDPTGADASFTFSIEVYAL